MNCEIDVPMLMENELSLRSIDGHWNDLWILIHLDSVDSVGRFRPQVRRIL